MCYTFSMSVANDISTQLVNAMRAKDTARLTALRNLKAAFTNELVALKRSPNAELTDEEAITVIKRLVKQRKDSIEQFRKGGREELVRAEEAEIKVLSAYLPQMMSVNEIRKIAEAKKMELGITDKSKLGQLIGAVMKETKGKADGAEVKKIVEQILNP